MPPADMYWLKVLPLYGCLVLQDQYWDEADEDGVAARRALRQQALTTNRYQAFLRPAQEAARIGVTVEIYTEPVPANPTRNPMPPVSIECPTGTLSVIVVSADAMQLRPDGKERIPLPNGPGRYTLQVLDPD